MAPPKLIPQSQPQLCSRPPASAVISHTPCAIYSGSHRSSPPNFPSPAHCFIPDPKSRGAPWEPSGRSSPGGRQANFRPSLLPQLKFKPLSHAQLCSNPPAAAFPTLPLRPTSRGSHRSSPPSPPHCFIPAPSPSRHFLETHRTPAREGELTADLHLPLHSSKSSPQSHTQIRSRPSTVASPHSLYPSSGD